jgi:hypothetical protein
MGFKVPPKAGALGKTYNLTTFQAHFSRNGTHNMLMLRAVHYHSHIAT